MLYVFYGTDEGTARGKANDLVHGLLSKHKSAELVRVVSETYAEGNLDGLLATQGLFKSNYIIYLDNLGDVYKEWGVQEYEQMHNSEHLCILVANKLGSTTLRNIENNCSKLVEYKMRKSRESFNIFAIANALKSKDKKRLWAELTELRLNGAEAEGVVGILFWAAKDVLLKGGQSKWSTQELRQLIVELAELPHKARRTNISLFDKIEQLILSRFVHN